jgi:hypothetical protein
VRSQYLPAHGAQARGNLWRLVRGDMDLEVGQGMEVVELPPMLPVEC